MAENINQQIFEIKDRVLTFDHTKELLYCKTADDSLLWVRKINETAEILCIEEDDSIYYMSCALDDIVGEMLAIHKDDGTTKWFIPGRPFFQKLFDKYLYIIFMDTSEQHYLLKVHLHDGSTIWHHGISNDLSEYVLTKNKIELTYGSGKIERLSVITGEVLETKE